MIKYILIFAPGISTFLFVHFEMPKKVKKWFFKIPIWISSGVISFLIGAIMGGVLGPMTGFATDLVLLPGFAYAKWAYYRSLRKEATKQATTSAQPAYAA